MNLSISQVVNSLALAGVVMGCCSTDSVEEVTRDVLTIIIATTIIIIIINILIIIILIEVTGVALTTLASVLAVVGLLSTGLIVTVL